MEHNLRIPPHNLEAERGIIGSILLDPVKSIGKCISRSVSAQDFYDRRHQAIFEQLLDMNQANIGMDAITIAEWLEGKNALDKSGGYDYLVQLQDSTLVPAHVDHYAKIVQNDAIRRDLIVKAGDMLDKAYSGQEEAFTLLLEAKTSLAEINDRKRAEAAMTNAQVSQKVIDRWASISKGEEYGIPWHIDALNDTFGNVLNTGNPYFIGAVPGGGKSVFLQNLFTNWSIFKGIPCAMASLEMTHEKLIERILAERADVSAWALNNAYYGDGSSEQRSDIASNWISKVEKARGLVDSAPLHIEDRVMNTDEICAWGLMMQDKFNIQAFGVDYFQLMNPPDGKKKEGLEAVKYNCGRLQEFSKSTGIITMVLSQIVKLPTDSSGRSRKPVQDDLYGGRIIDAHSEGTLMLWNDLDSEGNDNDTISIVKNRNGSCGDVSVNFNRARLRFEN